MLKKKMYTDVKKYWTCNTSEQITLKDTTVFSLLLEQIMAEGLLRKLMAINLQELEDKQVTTDEIAYEYSNKLFIF